MQDKYCIAQFFGGGKYWQIWRTVQESPKYSPPKLLSIRQTAKHPPNC